jgi:hypothetical protein
MYQLADVKPLNQTLMKRALTVSTLLQDIVTQQLDSLSMDLTDQGFSHADAGCDLGQWYMIVKVHR